MMKASSHLSNYKNPKSTYVSASAVGAVKRCPTLYCMNVKNIHTTQSKYSTEKGNRLHKQASQNATSNNANWIIRFLRWIFGWK